MPRYTPGLSQILSLWQHTHTHTQVQFSQKLYQIRREGVTFIMFIMHGVSCFLRTEWRSSKVSLWNINTTHTPNRTHWCVEDRNFTTAIRNYDNSILMRTTIYAPKKVWFNNFFFLHFECRKQRGWLKKTKMWLKKKKKGIKVYVCVCVHLTGTSPWFSAIECSGTC